MSFAISESRQLFPYQYLAEKATELRRLGMSTCAIARALRVTDKTITKALRLAAKLTPDPPGR
jgi:hypothetical protein